MTIEFRASEPELEPAYETSQSAGFDLKASKDCSIEPGKRMLVPTGVFITKYSHLCLLGFAGKFEDLSKVLTADNIPNLIELLPQLEIRPRSGLAHKKGITVLNSPGTIDADYPGEIMINLFNTGDETFNVTKGMGIAQGVVSYVFRPASVKVKDVIREGGHGSTDSKA